MNRFIRRAALMAGLVSILAISAGPVAAQDPAMIRVLHASPDAPAVDIYVDDAIVDDWTNVPFGTLSGYMSVPAGTYNVKVYATGTTSNPVIDANADVEAGMAYTIAAINPLASIEPKILVDDPALSYDKAMVRVVHFSPDAPGVDVAPDGAPALISNLEYPDDTGYLALDPGSYDLEVRLAGTDTVALQLDPVDLAGGTAYSVFAIGSAAAQPLRGNALQVAIGVDGEMLPDTAVAAETAGASPFSTTALLLGVAVMAFLVFSLFAWNRFARQTTR